MRHESLIVSVLVCRVKVSARHRFISHVRALHVSLAVEHLNNEDKDFEWAKKAHFGLKLLLLDQLDVKDVVD